MDFAGQKAAEELSFVIVIATSVIAFIAGAVKLNQQSGLHRAFTG